MPQWFQAPDHLKRAWSHEVMIILVYCEYTLIYRVPGKKYWVLLNVIKHRGSTASMPRWFRASDHPKRIRSHQVMLNLVYCEYILIYRVSGKKYRALSSVIEHRGSTASMPRWFRAPDHLKRIRSHEVMIILVYCEYILIYRVLGKKYRALSSVIDPPGSTASMSRWFRASDHPKQIRSHEVMLNLVYCEYTLIYRVPGKKYWVLSSVVEHRGSTASMPRWFWAPDHLKRIRSHEVVIILVSCEYILIYRVPGKNYRVLSSVIEHWGLMASMPRWFWASDHPKRIRSHEVRVILVYCKYILIYWVPGKNYRAL